MGHSGPTARPVALALAAFTLLAVLSMGRATAMGGGDGGGGGGMGGGGGDGGGSGAAGARETIYPTACAKGQVYDRRQSRCVKA